MTQISLFSDDIERSAVLSEDGVYRYTLTRNWGNVGAKFSFICLNPSTADAEVDDATVRKCMRFVAKWGGTGFKIVNLFAYRSTNPDVLKTVADPIGPQNDRWIEAVLDETDVVIAAWGRGGLLLNRHTEIVDRYRFRLHALKLSNDGLPWHPLYLRESLVPVPLIGNQRSLIRHVQA